MRINVDDAQSSLMSIIDKELILRCNIIFFKNYSFIYYILL